MPKSVKVVHLNFDEKDHEKLRERSASLGMPIATYSKAIILEYIGGGDVSLLPEKTTQGRKPRTISNNR